MNDKDKSPIQEGQAWTVSVPTEIFNKVKGDAVFTSIVTLARAVNALHFVQTPLISAENDLSPRGRRDSYNSLLFTSALFAEVILLVDGMKKHFKGNAAFAKMAHITSSPEATELRSANLKRVRNKLVFHFDMDEVRKQMKTLDLDNPVFVSAVGTKKLNTYHELADLTALRVLYGSEFPKDLSKVKPLLIHIRELVISFLQAAEEFMVALMIERGWTVTTAMPAEAAKPPSV